MSEKLLITMEIQKEKSLLDYFKNGNVLVVDDLPNQRKTIINMLHHMGIQDDHIIEAGDGDISLEIIQNEINKIIFVLLDLRMPRVSGFEVLRNIKESEKTRNIYVLLTTAEIDMEKIIHAVEYDVDGYLVKPFLTKTLEVKMLNIINPPDYLKMVKQGEELLRQGEYEKAFDILKNVLKINPESSGIRILMGKGYEDMNEKEKALQLYKEAVEKNPLFLRAHNALADYLLKIGDNRAALVALERAVKVNPLNPARHVMIGKLALEMDNDIKKAEKAFKASIKQNSQMAKEIAQIYLEHGYDEKSAEILQPAGLE